MSPAHPPLHNMTPPILSFQRDRVVDARPRDKHQPSGRRPQRDEPFPPRSPHGAKHAWRHAREGDEMCVRAGEGSRNFDSGQDRPRASKRQHEASDRRDGPCGSRFLLPSHPSCQATRGPSPRLSGFCWHEVCTRREGPRLLPLPMVCTSREGSPRKPTDSSRSGLI